MCGLVIGSAVRRGVLGLRRGGHRLTSRVLRNRKLGKNDFAGRRLVRLLSKGWPLSYDWVTFFMGARVCVLPIFPRGGRAARSVRARKCGSDGLQWGRGRRRRGYVGTAKVIQHVSSLKHIIVPGRVEGALQVGRKAPLRVFASQRKRVVLGGCSPVKRLGIFTGRCTRTLTRSDKVMTYVASRSRMITTTKRKDERCVKGPVDGTLRSTVAREDSIFTGKGSENEVPIARRRERPLCSRVVRPVVDTKSAMNSILLLKGGRESIVNRSRGVLVEATDKFLKERVRRWGW